MYFDEYCSLRIGVRRFVIGRFWLLKFGPGDSGCWYVILNQKISPIPIWGVLIRSERPFDIHRLDEWDNYIMNQNSGVYDHTQRGPMLWLLYAMAALMLSVSWLLRSEDAIPWVFLVVGLMILTLSAGFHYLRVKDEGKQLTIAFGPLPLFRKSISYDDIVSVQTGRTTILDGWWIHMSLRGGWVWNILGRDCVILKLKKGMLRVGSDDAEQLAAYIQGKISSLNRAQRKL